MMGFFDWFTGKGRKAQLDAPPENEASSADHAVPMPGGSPPSALVTPRAEGSEKAPVDMAMVDYATRLRAEVVRLRAQGKYDEALALARRAVAIDEKALGPDHINVGASLNELALSYSGKLDYASAAPLLQRALVIMERALGPDAPGAVCLRSNLVKNCEKRGDYASAVPLLRRALVITETTLGPDHPDVAANLNNLSALYWQMRDYARAAPLLQRALAIWEEALGPDHPDVATALNNLAELHRTSGDYALAESSHQRALAIREKTLRPDHPEIAISLDNLAGLYNDKGDHGRAEPLLRRARAIKQREFRAKPGGKAREEAPRAEPDASRELPPGVVTLVEVPGGIMLYVGLSEGTMLLTDRDTYDYRYGESKLPDPAQRDLDGLLPTVTRVRALSGGMLRGAAFPSHVLLDTVEPAALASFRRCLAISEDPSTFKHCACMGGPTLELFAGAELVATLGVQHGGAIRWGRWKHDADLRDGQRLNGWLVSNGVVRRLLDLLYENPLPTSGGRIEGPGSAPLSPASQRLFFAEILGQGFLADPFGRDNDPAPALRECDALLADHPEMGAAYAFRGLLRKCQGDFEGSVADFSQAIDHGGRSADLYFNRAVALDSMGRREDAMADCTRAIAIDPDHANAYNSRGIIRLMLGRLDEASSDFDAAIQRMPDWDLPYVNRAQVAVFRSDWGLVISDYTVAIEKTEKHNKDSRLLAGAYWNRGHARRMLGDQAGGDADQRVALAKDPNISPQ